MLETWDWLPGVRVKREDLNPTGSHKDRAAAYQLALAAERGERGVVISSSGNAAIATSRYAELYGIPAIVTLHPDIDPHKLAAIDGATTTIISTVRAINTAKRIAREYSIPNLRPSTSDDAVQAYQSLGEELVTAAGEIDDIVVFGTSGATALAIAQQVALHKSLAAVQFVQGSGNAAIAEQLGAEAVNETADTAVAAGRLGVRHSRRSSAVCEAVTATGGRGWIVSPGQAEEVSVEAARHGVVLSVESAANLCVARARAESGRRVVCIVSGSPPQSRNKIGVHTIDAADEFIALEALAAMQWGEAQ